MKGKRSKSKSMITSNLGLANDDKCFSHVVNKIVNEL